MWEKETSVAARAAVESGKILNNMFGGKTGIEKKGEIDLLTEADILSENAVMEIINKNFPRDAILTEESGEHGRESDRLWIIDPLDGTTNFAHSFPFFSVCIALRVQDEMVLSVVYNPFMNEYFEARRGEGAFLNKNPIKVSKAEDLKDSLVGTGFSYSVYKDPTRAMGLLQNMIMSVQGVRRPGAASVDLCYVASGRLDGFWEEGLQPWDTAAGSLIVKEAGGIVSDFEGEEYSPFQKSIVAANPHIYPKMLDILRGGRL
jgi:myo-inositol-1(or 4)-monophosphatase